MATRFGGVSGGVGSGTVTQVDTGTGLTGGPITTSGTLLLADTVVTPGTYGDGTHVSRVTIDQQGRITAASAVAITACSGTVTNVATGVGLTGGPITLTGTIDLANVAAVAHKFVNSVVGNALVLAQPDVSDLTGTGTGVITALGVNVGSAGAFVVLGGALGTPSSGTLTNASGLPFSGVAAATNTAALVVGTGGSLSTSGSGTITATAVAVGGITGLGTNVATALAVNVGSAGAFVTFNGALGTPSSGTLTSATGLPVGTGISGLGTGVATALAVNNNAAGGYTPIDGTATMTNKRMTFRAPTVTQSATPAINTDVTDYAEITALAQDITSMTSSLTGTPVKGDRLWVSITGTATRAITWGNSFEASTVALPTTTSSTTRLDIGFTWNVATTKWRCVAVA